MITGFGNNVVSSLAADITANQTTIQVMPGAGAIFAGLLTYDYANTSNPMQTYAKITLTDAKETVFEICHLTAVSNDTLTVVRAQEGTTAKGWALNDVIGNFATRGSENQFIQIEQLQSGHYISGIAGGTANALTLELPATYFVNGANNWTLRAPLVVYPAQNNTGATTLQLTMGGKVLGTFPVSKGNNTPLGAGDFIAGVPVALLYNEKDKRFQAINAITETGAVKSVNTHKPDASGNVKLGTAADFDTGTSDEKIPLLSTANTWSEIQEFKKDISVGTGGATSVINIGDSQIIRDNGKTGLIITSSSGTVTEGGAGIYLRPKGSTDSAMELHGNASGWNVDKLAVTTFTVNGSTTLKGSLNVGGAIINNSEDYVTKNGVGPVVDNSRFTRGYRITGINNSSADFGFTERIGQYHAISFHVVGTVNDAWFELRDNGDTSLPGNLIVNKGAQFGGNLVVSWGGRTATYQENGDIVGPVWGGNLTGYLSGFVRDVRQGSPGTIILRRGDWNYVPGGCAFTGWFVEGDAPVNDTIQYKPTQILIHGAWRTIAG